MGSTGTAYPPTLSISFMATLLLVSQTRIFSGVSSYYITGMPPMSFHYM